MSTNENSENRIPPSHKIRPPTPEEIRMYADLSIEEGRLYLECAGQFPQHEYRMEPLIPVQRESEKQPD